jgi:hypothetical protein
MRGSGLKRVLKRCCIDAGPADGVPGFYLETNSSLGLAFGLYQAMGFEHLPQTETPYVRADVFMERQLLAVAEDDADKDRGPVRGSGGHHVAVPDRAGELQALVHIEDHAG